MCKISFRKAGIRSAILTADTPPEQREAWYERQLKVGIRVFISHPRLVQVGLDLLFAPAIIWYQTGYSTFTVRQASRRSWRIGQKHAVSVRFLCYDQTSQVGCLRLMGKKLLVSMVRAGVAAVRQLERLSVAEALTRLAASLRRMRHWRTLDSQQISMQTGGFHDGKRKAI